jgi:hypothetical protein
MPGFSQPAEAPPPARGPGWRGVAVMVAIVLLIPALIGQGNLTKRRFDVSPTERIAKSHPAGVLLGDSMLASRIDAAVLTRAAGAPWEALAYPGSGSAWWYLALKNHVAVQPQPPPWAVILFRDRQLTLPAYSTEGRSRPRLEMLMRASEPLLDEVLAAASPRRMNWMERFAMAAYPLQKRRLEMREKVRGTALDIAARGGPITPIALDALHTFDVTHLRTDIGAFVDNDQNISFALDPEGHDFPAAVGKSFLPHIVELARSRGIRLLFYRVKHRPPAEGATVPDSPGLHAYLRDLREWLAKAGAIFIDEKEDAAVGLSYYGGDDHVREAMMAPYTEHFWSKVGPLLREAAAGAAGGKAP